MRMWLQKQTARGVRPVRDAWTVPQRQQIGPERVGNDRVGVNLGEQPLWAAQPCVWQAAEFGVRSTRVEPAEQQMPALSSN